MDAGARGGRVTLAWRAQTIKVHAVQCAKCGKFRSIPCKRMYEKIRADILERPWVCEDALRWDPKLNCELPDAFEGNPRFVLTMDKPGVPATPAGWDRSVHIRAGPGNEHFSDIFYFAPGNASLSARRLRSMKGVERYIDKHPEASPQPDDLRKECCEDYRRHFSFARPNPPHGFVKKDMWF
ncbi:hypothetical protein Mapa_007923 [Marchantia paleacea]|nr:hypothetical protein Mapa_007923 [Marchantia paleacea]